ncbi:glycosyltransferase [Flavobacteriaceae bacterium XHP0103]|uniref:glycosyltransferase n=1 Tax=Marixanthotalea marina TaxID=2844359 RepID=UPI002989CED3|nr:glycosyltransferase [Marixanthotalea marina]MBU3822091.1 glycosyltransferase [Marixanthotalea marina]
MKKRILIAPLNWGLGHATRCISIINALKDFGFEPIIGSDGDALAFLKKEFPDLTFVELPAYNIKYPNKGAAFKWTMLKHAPKILDAIKAEKKTTKRIVETYNITGIISDNRLGVYCKKIPCAIITHQLNVLSGRTTWLSTLLHRKFIKQFDVCWVPDLKDEENLSGKLGHGNSTKIPIKYIGPLSRFYKKKTAITNKILVLLSGPEPQRTLLFEKLFKLFECYKEQVIIVRGIVENKQDIQTYGRTTVYNFMTSYELEKTINESELIICRSGYTSIMDLAKLEKKAFLIPTPGQYEQEYLAKKLTEQKIAPSCNQNDFTLEKLKEVENYDGFKALNFKTDFRDLFSLFQSK